MRRPALIGAALWMAAACGQNPVETPEDAGPGSRDASGVVPKYTCTSDVMWDRGDEGNERMHPGMACISCHNVHADGGHGSTPGEHDVPSFTLAGTLYATLHELNDCNGVPGAVSNARIEITDDAGKRLSLIPNSSGNFFTEEALRFPIRAKVAANGLVREMLTAQPSGDCNSCHTPGGLSGAPGRVRLPE